MNLQEDVADRIAAWSWDCDFLCVTHGETAMFAARECIAVVVEALANDADQRYPFGAMLDDGKSTMESVGERLRSYLPTMTGDTIGT